MNCTKCIFQAFIINIIIYSTPKAKSNRDDCKTLFHWCLLHMIRLREVGVKMNAKTAFQI